MNLLVLWVTEAGRKIARKIVASFSGQEARFETELVQRAFQQRRPLVFVGACGIAVRAIAPHLRHKNLDPPVLVVDERGRFVISLLSGHLGGANRLAQELASLLSATPVITTASDLYGLPALDLWLRERGVLLEDWQALKRLEAKLLREKRLKIYLEPPLSLDLPKEFVSSPGEEADFILSYREESSKKPVFLVRALVLGFGFHEGEKDLLLKIRHLLQENRLSEKAVCQLATIKRRQREHALETLRKHFGVPIHFYSEEEIKKTSPPSFSKAEKALRLPGVAEPCALLASGFGPIVLPKKAFEGITLAVALEAKLARSEMKPFFELT